MKQIILILLLMVSFGYSQYDEIATVDTWIKEGGSAADSLATSYGDLDIDAWLVGAVEYAQGLVWFPDVMDSLNSWSSVDTAAIILTIASFGASNDSAWVYRMIADEEWKDSLSASFRYVYAEAGGDTASWAAGEGDQTSSYTTNDGVALGVPDSTASGELIYIITDMMEAARVAGAFYGFWIKATINGDRVYFHSLDVADDEPRLYMEGSVGSTPIYLNLGVPE